MGPATGPSLIPITVSEIDNQESSREKKKCPSSTLHMSGGGVYTTDSFYGQYCDQIETKSPSSPRGISVIKKTPIKSIIRSQKKDVETNSKNIDPVEGTLRLPSSLEITPIKCVTQGGAGKLLKRKHGESSELVITKIPRISNTHAAGDKVETESSGDMTFDCKLILSSDDKKVRLLFENGLQIFLNRSDLKNVQITDVKPVKNIRRKNRKPKKIKSLLKNENNVFQNEAKTSEAIIAPKQKENIPQTKSVLGKHKLPSMISKPINSALLMRKKEI